MITHSDYPYTSDTINLTPLTEKLYTVDEPTEKLYTTDELTAGLYYYTKPAPRQIPIAALFVVALILIGAGAMLAMRYGDGAAVLSALGCGTFLWLAFGKRGER